MSGRPVRYPAWITGASSGLGRGVAEELAHRDGSSASLILSGRNETRLHETAELCRSTGASVVELPFDLQVAAEREAAIKTIQDKGMTVATLVNNAGVSQRSLARDTQFSVDRMIVETDLVATIHLTKLVLPAMLATGAGRIVAVSSIAGLAGMPLRSTYCAAKAGQIAFSAGLRAELRGTGVSVHTAIVGFVRTDVSRNALTGSGGRYGTMDPNQAGGVDPRVAARSLIAQARRGRGTITIGRTPKVMVFLILNRWFPRLLAFVLGRARVT